MNRWNEGREILGILYDDDPHGVLVNYEIDNIRQSFERAGNSNLTAMFKMGPQRSFHRVVLATTVQVFLQMSGVNSISYYAPTIYSQQLKFSPTTSGILAASTQFATMLGSFCCVWTVDRFGRRRLMLFSASSMSVCFACLSGLVSHPDNPAALKAGVFFLFLYSFVYVLGFLGIPFLYASEIAPVHLRAATFGLSTAVSWLFNFLVAEVTPIAFTNIGWKYFLVYCCLNAAFVPMIYFFFPETAKYSLEEIDEIFESSNTIFDTVRAAKKLKNRKQDVSDRAEKCVNADLNEASHIEEVGAMGTNSLET
jgi:MFS family permease